MMLLKDKGSYRWKEEEESIVKTGCLVKKQINIYRQRIRQLQHQQLAVEENLHTSGDGKFQMFSFKKINH